MDIASFVATVTDQNLRREIFMGMDEATITALPPNLMAEARQVQDYIRMDRDRRQREGHDRARILQQMGMGHHGQFDMDPANAVLGGRRGDPRQRAQSIHRL